MRSCHHSWPRTLQQNSATRGLKAGVGEAAGFQGQPQTRRRMDVIHYFPTLRHWAGRLTSVSVGGGYSHAGRCEFRTVPTQETISPTWFGVSFPGWIALFTRGGGSIVLLNWRLHTVFNIKKPSLRLHFLKLAKSSATAIVRSIFTRLPPKQPSN